MRKLVLSTCLFLAVIGLAFAGNVKTLKQDTAYKVPGSVIYTVCNSSNYDVRLDWGDAGLAVLHGETISLPTTGPQVSVTKMEGSKLRVPMTIHVDKAHKPGDHGDPYLATYHFDTTITLNKEATEAIGRRSVFSFDESKPGPIIMAYNQYAKIENGKLDLLTVIINNTPTT